RIRALDDRLERPGVAPVIVLRLLFFLAPPLNWVLGATRVRLSDYVVGTAIGILPGIALTVFLADRITDARSAADLLTAEVLTPALVLAVLIGAGVTIGRRFLAPSRAREHARGGEPPPRAARRPPPPQPRGP